MEMENIIKESKHEKFVRLAESRTNKLIKMIKLLENCSNSSVYEYTEAEVNKIFAVLESELKNARKKFNSNVNPKAKNFSLKGNDMYKLEK